LQIARRSNVTRNLKSQSLDVIRNMRFRVKVIDMSPFSVGIFVVFWQSTVNVMFDAHFLRDIGNKSTFLFLFDVLRFFNLVCKVICNSEEPVGTFQCIVEGSLIVEVALLKLNIGAKFEKLLGRWFIDIASQCANLDYQRNGVRGIPPNSDFPQALSRRIPLGFLTY
jgi:hypothetical protein